MITRRILLASLLGIPLFARLSVGQEDWQDVLSQIIQNEDDPIFLGAKPLPIDDPHWQLAREYLETSPTTGSPFEVATHLDQILPTILRAEWDSIYANPLIVLLFAATATEPAGDTTPWCAAFMSWCIERVGVTSPRSTASKSYRTFGTALWEKGDVLPSDAPSGSIAVFRTQSNPDRGHVGFYAGPGSLRDRQISVLGGNQSDTVGYSPFRSDADLELHSIRRL